MCSQHCQPEIRGEECNGFGQSCFAPLRGARGKRQGTSERKKETSDEIVSAQPSGTSMGGRGKERVECDKQENREKKKKEHTDNGLATQEHSCHVHAGYLLVVWTGKRMRREKEDTRITSGQTESRGHAACSSVLVVWDATSSRNARKKKTKQTRG